MQQKLVPKNLLVRMPNWVGDLVMALPVLTDLRAAFPEATITAMCYEHLAELVERESSIDEIFRFSRPSGWLPRIRERHLIQSLRQGGYDVGLLLTNSLSSAWWFWRSRVTKRIGYRGHHRRWLLTDIVPGPKEDLHQIAQYKTLLQPFGIAPSKSEPTISVGEDEIEAARRLLRQLHVPEDRPLIGINPGAAYGSAKCWMPERFEQLTQRILRETDYPILYFGDHSQAKLIQHILTDMPERVINLAGRTTLRELIALIACCKVLVTNDSGPMHIAYAVGTPPLALFGSTSDTKTGPTKGVVIHKHVSCSPCFLRTCPIDFRCMKRIEVDEVYQTLAAMMVEPP